MRDFQFIMRGKDSGRTETITINANIRVQAEDDARQVFRSLYREEPILIASSPEGP